MPDVAADRKQWQQLLGQPHCLDQPHAFAVERDRTRQVVSRRFAFKHDDAKPAHPEQIGKRCTDRPIADDADIEWWSGGHLGAGRIQDLVNPIFLASSA